MKYNQHVCWDNVWKNISHSSLSTKVRSEWYKAVHDLIPTNQRLHRINMVNGGNCKICGKLDSLQHRLTECSITKGIWRHLAVQLACVYRRHIEAIVPTILLYPQYKFKKNSKMKLVNHLIGSTVFYILSNSRCNEEDYKLFLQKEKLKKL